MYAFLLLARIQVCDLLNGGLTPCDLCVIVRASVPLDHGIEISICTHTCEYLDDIDTYL